MIKNIVFKNFRGLKKIELTELEQITLISGKNNSGKSSILEGIFLMIDHISPDIFIKINYLRNMAISYNQSILWEPLFYNLNTKVPIQLFMQLDNESAKLEYQLDDSFSLADNSIAPQKMLSSFTTFEKLNYALKFNFIYGNYTENGYFSLNSSGIIRTINRDINNDLIIPLNPIVFISPKSSTKDDIITEWFGKLELRGKKQQVIDILKIMDSSICDISTIALHGQTQLYTKINEKLLPLKLAGDGINKLLFIVLAILENADSIILIDEIETGFHYSMYDKIWKVIATAAKEYHCQVIATTHSYECINGAVDGIKEANMQDKFCYFRIDRINNENRAFRYTESLLNAAITSNMEVR